MHGLQSIRKRVHAISDARFLRRSREEKPVIRIIFHEQNGRR
jgi:hypothetical protein